jgi:glutamate-1-semialdehyde 2,1-aminomutase
VAAAQATIDLLERDDRALHRRIHATGTRLRDGLAALGAASGLPVRVQGPGPMFHMGFSAVPRVTNYRECTMRDQARYQRFAAALLLRGVRVIERGLWYVSAAHGDAEIDATLAAAEAALAEIR